MRDFSKRLQACICIAFITSLCVVNTAIAQVNEKELKDFFSHRGYKLHNANYAAAVKAFIDSEQKKVPRGSFSYENYQLLRQALGKKAPVIQAPPFLDLNIGQKSDIGMLSVNSSRVAFIKLFQVLDENRSLVKFASRPYESDDKWSEVFLYFAEDGTNHVDGGIEEGKIFALGVTVFERLDDFVYKNQLGNLRKVGAVRLLSMSDWEKLVINYQAKPPEQKPNAQGAKEMDFQKAKQNGLPKNGTELKRAMLFETKDGNFSVTAIYISSTDKQVILKRVDNSEEVMVERKLLSDKTNALIKEKEELKRMLESSL